MWQFESWEVDSLDVYVGADITKSVIEANKQRFLYHTNKFFHQWDFAACEIPLYRHKGGNAQAFDLIHVRDVLQHMPLARGVQAVEHLKRSGARFLLMTTFQESKNTDLKREGGFYYNNLKMPPFSFPSPIKCMETHPDTEPDLTCLYAVHDFTTPERDENRGESLGSSEGGFAPND